MPIQCFKNHEISSFGFEPETVFLSSGTGSSQRSAHLVDSLAFYKKVSASHFTRAFGSPEDYCHLALLPSYLEQGQSSLVAMVDNFIQSSRFSQSNFYLDNLDELFEQLIYCRDHVIPTVLWGVSYALLDFFEANKLDFPNLLVLETGGMKGRKREIIRSELHQKFTGRTNARISSEYGMTELLSQAYLNVNGYFTKPLGVWVVGKEINDPLSNEAFGRTARVGIIDTANIHSCAFIQTEDLGRIYESGNFEIMGRMDYSDLRGCNLMVHDLE